MFLPKNASKHFLLYPTVLFSSFFPVSFILFVQDEHLVFSGIVWLTCLPWSPLWQGTIDSQKNGHLIILIKIISPKKGTICKICFEIMFATCSDFVVHVLVMSNEWPGKSATSQISSVKNNYTWEHFFYFYSKI